jgi:adenosine deaminase
MNSKTPLVDTHRHLGGSISPECVWEIIKSKKLKYLASSLEDVVRSMTFQADEPRDFYRFLNKFRILDEIIWDPETIDLMIRGVCDSLENESIEYCWMDFTINKYMNFGWHKKDAISFIYECFERYRPGQVGLMLSLKYESQRETQRQHAKLIDDADVANMLVGIDLVGDESYFDADFYAPIFKEWKSANKVLRAHAGESQGAENIQAAIEMLGVTNIAHGFKCVENERLVDIAKQNNIVFDLAITSNYVTGVVREYPHPALEMLTKGLNITIGSDDPIQLGTTLEDEFNILKEMLLDDPQIDVEHVLCGLKAKAWEICQASKSSSLKSSSNIASCS